MRKAKKIIRLCLLLMLLAGCLSFNAEAAFKKTAPKVKTQVYFTSVKLSWTKRSSLDGYEVFRTNASNRTRRKVRTVTKTKCYVRKLTPGKKYYYVVRGYKDTDKGRQYTKDSAPVSVRMPAYNKNATIKELLKTALLPVGKTVYVWGGGWNKADNGAGKAARTLGVSPKWEAFYKKQDSSYNYRNTRYQIEDGLDCSGYVGWVIYNAFETRNNRKGYVMYADQMAGNFAGRGWGTFTPKSKVKDWKAGDIMSSSGHVYIVVGQCSDGSVVLMHASPPGVFICGTSTASGAASQAQDLAARYMRKYFPDYCEKFPDVTRGAAYLTDYDQMRWSVTGNCVMTDPDGYTKKRAGAILQDLLGPV